MKRLIHFDLVGPLRKEGQSLVAALCVRSGFAPIKQASDVTSRLMVEIIVPCCSKLISGVRKGRRGVLGLDDMAHPL